MPHPTAVELTPSGSPTPLLPLYKTRPNWFIQRDNGVYVPVIPVDELPPDIELDGAPRELKMDDAQGMRFLERVPLSGQTYTLARSGKVAEEWNRRHSQHHYTRSQTSLRPLRLSASARPSIVEAGERGHARTQSENVFAKPFPIAPVPSAPPIITGDPGPKTGSLLESRPLPPSGREPDLSKKEYCTYWIKTGECDFMQQGCLFKHEMPDLTTLREKVGIGSVPHWYQVRCAMARREDARKSLGDGLEWVGGEVVQEEDEDADASGSEHGEAVEERERLKRADTMPPWFRAPDDDVRKMAEREQVDMETSVQAQQKQSAHHDDLIDPSTPAENTNPATTALPDRTRARKGPLIPATRLPSSAPPHARSISEAQADIFKLMRSAHTAAPPSRPPSGLSRISTTTTTTSIPSPSTLRHSRTITSQLPTATTPPQARHTTPRKRIPETKRYFPHPTPPAASAPALSPSTSSSISNTSSTSSPTTPLYPASAIPTPTSKRASAFIHDQDATAYLSDAAAAAVPPSRLPAPRVAVAAAGTQGSAVKRAAPPRQRASFSPGAEQGGLGRARFAGATGAVEGEEVGDEDDHDGPSFESRGVVRAELKGGRTRGGSGGASAVGKANGKGAARETKVPVKVK
ncbi:Zinc finger CCCH-type protein [Macrophomina phaseolina MS6]|uniref:Zinc finger CCCH-type protein n=1 Tax=Macrophomina phaseolina (strain MS6) TaxID=1126212 RepID=K2QX77_MACPH|nr:Zinc finger CCCH-type protein [Macrophomina phaseolina MS6]